MKSGENFIYTIQHKVRVSPKLTNKTDFYQAVGRPQTGSLYPYIYPNPYPQLHPYYSNPYHPNPYIYQNQLTVILVRVSKWKLLCIGNDGREITKNESRTPGAMR